MIALLSSLLLLGSGIAQPPAGGPGAAAASGVFQEPTEPAEQESENELHEQLLALRIEIAAAETQEVVDEPLLRALRNLADLLEGLQLTREGNRLLRQKADPGALVDEARKTRDQARALLLAVRPDLVPVRLRLDSSLQGTGGDLSTDALRSAVKSQYEDPVRAARDSTRSRSRESSRLSDEVDAATRDLMIRRNERLDAEKSYAAQRQEAVGDLLDLREQRMQRLRLETAKRKRDLLDAQVSGIQARLPFQEAEAEIAKLNHEVGRFDLERLQSLFNAAQGFLRDRIAQDRGALDAEILRLGGLLEQELPTYDREWFAARHEWLLASRSYMDTLERNAALEIRKEQLRSQELTFQDRLDPAQPAVSGSRSKPSADQVAEEIRGLKTATNPRRLRQDRSGIAAESRWASARMADPLIAEDTIAERLDHQEEAARIAFEAQDFGENTVLSVAWNLERRRWTALRRDHLDLSLREHDLLQRHLGAAMEMDSLRQRTHLAAITILEKLRRENLFLRGQSPIDLGALRTGLTDLGTLPRWVGQVALGFKEWARRSLWPVAGWLAILISTLVVFLPLRRRWGGWIAQAATSGEPSRERRYAVVLGYLLRAAVTALVLWGLTWSAIWVLPAMPPDVERWLESLGMLAGVMWLARRLNIELFRPEPRSRAILHMPPEVAAAAFTRVSFLLYFLTVIWPIRFSLTAFGYQNAAVLEVLRLASHLVSGLVLIDLLWRRRLITSIQWNKEGQASRLANQFAGMLNPFLMLLVPLVMVLDLLRFDFLVEVVLRTACVLVAALLGGSLLFHGANFLIRMRLAEADAGQPAGPLEAAHSHARIAISRALVFVVVVLGGGWVMTTAGWVDLASVCGFLNVPLPFQGLEPEAQVTWWDLFTAAFGIWLGFRIAHYLRLLLSAILLPKTRMERGLQYTVTTISGYFVIGLAVYLGMSRIFSLQSLGYVIAALSVGIGFGLQEVVSNFVSGLILLFERPLQVGDTVRVGDTEGEVERINIRSTTVRSINNIFVLVPNKDLITQNVINYTHFDPRLRLVVPVGVAYGSDTELVQGLLNSVAKENARVLKRPAPEVVFQGFGESSLDFELRVWIGRPDYRIVARSELNFAIDRVFRENGVTIPFPQRDLHLKSSDQERLVDPS